MGDKAFVVAGFPKLTVEAVQISTGDKPDPICVAAGAELGVLKGLTNATASKLSTFQRAAYCVGVKGMKDDEKAVVKRCFPELAKVLMRMCPGDSGDKSDGKGDKGDGGDGKPGATLVLGGSFKT